MATLRQWTEIIGEYPAPVFLLTRPLKGLCFKCRASESRQIIQLALVKPSDTQIVTTGIEALTGECLFCDINIFQSLLLTRWLTVSTELGLLSAHIRNLIQNGKVNFFGDQYFSITLGDTVINVGEDVGVCMDPYSRVSINPPIPAQFCPPYPRPLFSFFFFFRVPPPQIQFFAKAPSPSYPRRRPFFAKSPPNGL